MKSSLSIWTRAAYKYINFASHVRVLAYTNSFVSRSGIRTRVHLNNFISPLFPEIKDSLPVVINFYSPAGELIASDEKVIPYCGSEVVDVNAFLGGRLPECGMVLAYARISRHLEKRLRALNIPIVGSYFFVSWETPEGNFSCSHSIEAYKGRYFGIPRVLTSLISPDPTRESVVWTSNKTIEPKRLEHAYFALSNPTATPHVVEISVEQGGAGVFSRKSFLSAMGTEVVSCDFSQRDMGIEPMTFTVNGLIGNAKPYVFLKYQNRGYYAHHM